MTVRCRSLLVLFTAASGLTACSGDSWTPPNSDGPSDQMPPVVIVWPRGGTYGSVMTVTLTATEPAAIYYSVDGNDPVPRAPNTTVGTSPVSVVMPGGTTVLKHYARDRAGNVGAIGTETYVIDLTVPNVTIEGSLDPMGLLASREIGWQSDKPGAYSVELGGTGTPGSGTVLSAGDVAAGMPMSQVVRGTQLSLASPTSIWVHVTDTVGHTGSASVGVALEPLVSIDVGGELGQTGILPDGRKAYVAARDSGTVAVIDTDPSSPSFETVLANVTVGERPEGIAVTPDGTRVYVTVGGANAIAVLDSTTDTVLTTIPLASLSPHGSPSGIAVTPDGTRAYFLVSDEIAILDVDPASPGYDTVTGAIPRPLLLAGAISIASGGARAVTNWQGTISHGLDVLDVDPASGGHDTIVYTPFVVEGLGGDVAVSPDGHLAYVTDAQGHLAPLDLQTFALGAEGPPSMQQPFATTPDGTTLLAGVQVGGESHLEVVDTGSLGVAADLPWGTAGDGLGSIAVTPDGSRAYVSRDGNSSASRVVMVPLR